MANKTYQSKLVGLLLILMLLLVACGGTGSDADNDAASSGDDSPPTSTPFPTFAFVAPTNPPVFNQDAESTDEPDAEATESVSVEETETIELDPKMVERGKGRYEALDCGECHGENGEGVDDIVGLLDMNLSEDAFITYMRTGGDIGSSHQYSTDRLSANGARNLYQYVLSFAQGD